MEWALDFAPDEFARAKRSAPVAAFIRDAADRAILFPPEDKLLPEARHAQKAFLLELLRRENRIPLISNHIFAPFYLG